MKTFKYQTLHCHTITSDGDLTYEQVLDECEKNNIGVVAFTDHDSLPTIEKIEELKKLNHNVKFITGIEMSATTIKEVEGSIELFHIVGLFIDPTNKDLVEYCENSKNKRVERTKKIISSCKKIGFEITYDDVSRFMTGSVVGRPHIAKAILAKEKNVDLIGELVEKLRVEAKSNAQLAPLYDEVRNADLWQKVFTLFLSSDAYIKGVYEHYEDHVDMDHAVQLIRNAGGIALIAHWTYFSDQLTFEIAEKLAREHRIDGFETVYAFGVGNDQYNKFVSDMMRLDKLCDENGLVKGGGGDFHKITDFTLMNDPRFESFAVRTNRLIEKIAEIYPSLNRSWSSL